MTKTMTYVEAIRDAQRLEMERDPNVFIAGEDVALIGSPFGQTAGILEEFGPERILDTPISESQIIGLGVGAAAMGLRPIVCIDFMDFIGCCTDEVVNQAAKLPYMLGGQISLPMVIRTNIGGGINAAAQHSQCLEAMFTSIPGLKIVTGGTPADVKGLLEGAVRDNNPVLVLEHKAAGGLTGEVPEGEYVLPIGKAAVKRPGTDVTIVTYSTMIYKCLAAAETLAQAGISAEVIDLLSLVPLDKECILKSVEKTGRAVIVHEAVEFGGFGGEIAAIIADEGFDLLNAPVKRVGAPFTPVPFSAVLEKEYQPSEEKIVSVVKSLF
ncbi:MAG: alpha-ketoacid dehydrogenase subunit beta [Propionibacteriaceae bacterium]|nr:alpha-ketoacid dehydrogenase subunit beta [Propionibacteriaceae bacterium]